MLQHQSLSVIEPEAQIDTPTDPPAPAVDELPELASLYDDAGEAVAWREYEGHYTFERFVDAVLDAVGKDYDHADARLVDDEPDTEDVDFGVLAALPDESLLFVGSDPTAKDAVPWFAFTVEPTEPVPAPTDAGEALDLLKPPRVREYIDTAEWPPRHGEWWLMPCELVPAGTVFTPGVSRVPYGPSPLGNHVPREYAFTRTDSAFMDAFRDAVPEAPASLDSPPEVLRWTWRQVNKEPTPEQAPSWAEVRSFAGDVLVRGTVRHRENDHYVESLGERWHLADTHDVAVYTGDAMAQRVHLDYHGL